MLKRIGKMLKNKKGFSLIELIVVIAILAVIAGLATPNIVGAIINARISADRTNAAQIATAMQRVLAEGGALVETTDGTVANADDVDEEANIIIPLGKTGAESLYPTYIQSIPQSQLNPAPFRYTYADDVLTIYAKSRDTESSYVEIWPDLSDSYK